MSTTKYKLAFTASQIDTKLGEIDSLAKKSELPTSLKNPEALTINNIVYDGSEAKDITNAIADLVNTGIGSLDLTDYALKTDIPNIDLTDYALKTDIPSHTGLATENFVLAEIAKAELNDKEVDLTAYYTKDEVNGLIPDVSGFATVSELNKLSNTVNSADKAISALAEAIVDKADKAEIPTVPTKVSQLANDKNYISSIPDEYITESELNTKGYLTEHQSLAGYATEAFVTTKIEELQPAFTIEDVNALIDVKIGVIENGSY